MTTIGSWSTQQVCSWLRSMQMRDLVSIFKENDIDGPILVQLDDIMLTELGIESKVCSYIPCQSVVYCYTKLARTKLLARIKQAQDDNLLAVETPKNVCCCCYEVIFRPTDTCP